MKVLTRDLVIPMGSWFDEDDAALESGYFLEVSDKPFVASPAQCEDYGIGEWTDNGDPIADLLAD